MKKITRFFIGAIFIYSTFLIFGGLEFLLISIICTAGFSLAIYIPLAYQIGLGLEKFYYKLTGKNEGQAIDGELLSSYDKALIKYINDARVSGISDEIIKRNLYENGWQSEQVEKILDYLKMI